ncbi:MFS transporter [Citricoccus sp. SGAir0253]|uniref:MFS transporter n=1 Tax=Citricoccus sp. SGAir0253 TaxID=2567881 RepID=UPI0010CD3C57|nr:MFS transporter [Citricoccus sp. SGAir0253]QCU78481.1 MFS transporter [Citricoccus sp. SGAir0253]
MNFAAYGQLLRDVRLRRVLGIGFVARFPHSAAGIILTLHVAVTMGLGYGAAGLATAAMTLGLAVGAPWRGRQVDRHGLRRALVPSVVAEALVWTVVPHLPFPWLLAGVFLGGVFALPVFSVVRQSIGVLTRGQQRETAFALDSIITETIFMMGPALGAVVATGWSSAWGLAIIGWSAAVAGLYLMWFDPPTRSEQVAAPAGGADGDYSAAEDRDRAVTGAVHGAPAHLELTAPEVPTGALPLVPAGGAGTPSGGPDGGADPGAPVPGGSRRRGAGRLRAAFSWLTPSALAVLVVSGAAGMLMVGTEVAMVAELEHAGLAGQVGIVYATWCGASAVGGLLYGAAGRRISPLLLMGVFALGTLPLALVDGVWPLALVAVLSGLFTAPTLAAASAQLSRIVPEDRRGEAMGYYGSAMTAGAAMGAPVAGIVIDGVAPEAGYLLAAGVALALVGVAVVARTVLRWRRGAGAVAGRTAGQAGEPVTEPAGAGPGEPAEEGTGEWADERAGR